MSFPVREDLLVDLGAGFYRSFTYIAGDGTQPDFSTWTAVASFRRYEGIPETFLSLTDGHGITLGPDGSIVLHLTAAQTSALVLPSFMDWGVFPGEGTATSPNDSSVSGRLAAWEIRLTNSDNTRTFIPLAGICCFRVGPTSPTPEATTPSYQIFVEPQASQVSWASSGYQIDAPLVLDVTIVRTNGHVAPINVSLPVMDGSWVGWIAQVNGIPVTQIQAENVPYIIDAAPDHFQMVFYGTQAGWSIQHWQGGVQLIGSDGSDVLVKSNVFSVIF